MTQISHYLSCLTGSGCFKVVFLFSVSQNCTTRVLCYCCSFPFSFSYDSFCPHSYVCITSPLQAVKILSGADLWNCSWMDVKRIDWQITFFYNFLKLCHIIKIVKPLRYFLPVLKSILKNFVRIHSGLWQVFKY